MPDKYSKIDEKTTFAFLANALGGGGDRGQSFPQSDAEDFSRGVRFVPGEVTLARRRGEQVNFVDRCGPCCWYWEFPDGKRIYHWERWTYERIAQANGADGTENEEAGPCPACGNPHTSGGTIEV